MYILTKWCTFSPNGKTINIDVLSTGLCSTLMDTFWCPLLNIGADWWLITCWYTLSGQPMLCHCWSLVNIGAHCYKLVHDILVRHIVWCAALLCHQLVTVAPEDWVSHHWVLSLHQYCIVNCIIGAPEDRVSQHLPKENFTIEYCSSAKSPFINRV